MYTYIYIYIYKMYIYIYLFVIWNLKYVDILGLTNKNWGFNLSSNGFNGMYNKQTMNIPESPRDSGRIVGCNKVIWIK